MFGVYSEAALQDHVEDAEAGRAHVDDAQVEQFLGALPALAGMFGVGPVDRLQTDIAHPGGAEPVAGRAQCTGRGAALQRVPLDRQLTRVGEEAVDVGARRHHRVAVVDVLVDEKPGEAGHRATVPVRRPRADMGISAYEPG